MVFLGVLRLERSGDLLHKRFQKYDSVETFRNAKRAAKAMSQSAGRRGKIA